jgi:predicted nucleic acid-binding protein
MIFFDTNILVYSLVNIDSKKQKQSDSYIEYALSENTLIISPLVISELIYTLAKLDTDKNSIQRGISIFSDCCKHDITKDLTIEAFAIAMHLNRGTSINDFIHLKFAEKHCNKLLTFDTGYDQLKRYSTLEIEVLS